MLSMAKTLVKQQYKQFTIKKSNNKIMQQFQPAAHPIADQELRLSISSINRLMERINEVVKRSQENLNKDQCDHYSYQHHYGKFVKDNNYCGTFVTHQNLITEDFGDSHQGQESQWVTNLRKKINNSLKIPLHQLHRKNKLSTVVQQSQSQSGRTNQQSITPRDTSHRPLNSYDILQNHTPENMGQCFSFTKQVLQMSKLNNSNNFRNILNAEVEEKLEQELRQSKKITGIRKTSRHKSMKGENTQLSSINKQNQKQLQIKSKELVSNTKNERASCKFVKTKSMMNVKCDFFERNKQVIADEVQTENNEPRSKSRSRKGLSVFSKQSYHQQLNHAQVRNFQGTAHKNKAASLSSASSHERQKTKKIQIKRRTIHPFLINKKLNQVEKKPEKPESKSKNCLSRTNIRQFFVSKRINK